MEEYKVHSPDLVPSTLPNLNSIHFPSNVSVQAWLQVSGVKPDKVSIIDSGAIPLHPLLGNFTAYIEL